MIFQFVVKHLRFLARFPLAPHVFDALLLTWTALVAPKRLRAIDAVESFAGELPGVERTRHRFGGTGFECNGVEFAHVHGNGLLDIHLTRSIAEHAIDDSGADEHHVCGRSAWISYWLASPDDLPNAKRLLEKAYALIQCERSAPL